MPLKVPCVGLAAITKVKVSPEVPGVPFSVIAIAVFILVLTLWLFASGGGGPAVTIIETVAVLDTTLFSVTSNVKVSGPM